MEESYAMTQQTQDSEFLYYLIFQIRNDPLFLPHQSSWPISLDKMVFIKPEPVIKAAHSEGSTLVYSQVNQLVITRNPKMCNFLDYK